MHRQLLRGLVQRQQHQQPPHGLLPSLAGPCPGRLEGGADHGVLCRHRVRELGGGGHDLERALVPFHDFALPEGTRHDTPAQPAVRELPTNGVWRRSTA